MFCVSLISSFQLVLSRKKDQSLESKKIEISSPPPIEVSLAAIQEIVETGAEVFCEEIWSGSQKALSKAQTSA